jgi:hypothetical protein
MIATDAGGERAGIALFHKVLLKKREGHLGGAEVRLMYLK